MSKKSKQRKHKEKYATVWFATQLDVGAQERTKENAERIFADAEKGIIPAFRTRRQARVFVAIAKETIRVCSQITPRTTGIALHWNLENK